MGNHVAQNLGKSSSKIDRYHYYNISCLLPKGEFIKDYPSNPKSFGEKLRKARMDAGLQINELAEKIGVTPESVINWELRGISPKKKEVRKNINLFIEKLKVL